MTLYNLPRSWPVRLPEPGTFRGGPWVLGVRRLRVFGIYANPPRASWQGLACLTTRGERASAFAQPPLVVLRPSPGSGMIRPKRGAHGLAIQASVDGKKRLSTITRAFQFPWGLESFVIKAPVSKPNYRHKPHPLRQFMGICQDHTKCELERAS